jgi:hypothetical protein
MLAGSSRCRHKNPLRLAAFGDTEAAISGRARETLRAREILRALSENVSQHQRKLAVQHLCAACSQAQRPAGS